ncbi:hypothetical protein EON64_10450, partial [archaeon]
MSSIFISMIAPINGCFKWWRMSLFLKISFVLFCSLFVLPSPAPTGQPSNQPTSSPFKVSFSDYMGVDTYAGYTDTTYNSRGNLDNILYARLDLPRGMYIDASSVFYLIEKNFIRSVSTSNVNTIILGLGSLITENAAASSSSLTLGYGITGDTAGNIYYSDATTCLVRKITISSMLVSTVAGVRGDCSFGGDSGQGTSAQLNQPKGVFIMNTVLFIADFANNRVRSLDLATNIVSTLIGTGSTASSLATGVSTAVAINGPECVWGNNGLLYLEDQVLCALRFVSVATFATAVVSGTGTCAAPPVISYVPATPDIGAIEAICGAVSAMFYVFKSSFGLYRHVSTTSAQIYAGGTSTYIYAHNTPLTSIRIDRAGGCVGDTNGNIYLSDYTENRIWRITSSVAEIYAGYVGGVSFPRQQVSLGRVTSIWDNSLGDMYFAEWDRHRVSMVQKSSSFVSVVAGTGYTPYVLDNVAATLAPVSGPRTVVGDTNGHLYIAEYNSARIRRVDKITGLISTIVGGTSCTISSPTYSGAGTTVCIATPTGLVIDTSGVIYFSSDADKVIRKLVVPSNIVSLFAGTGSYTGPGVQIVNTPATVAVFEQPKSMWLDVWRNNTLYFGDYNPRLIRKVYFDQPTSTWRMVSYGGTGDSNSIYNGDVIPATQANIAQATGVCGDTSGNVFIATIEGRYRLRMIDFVTQRVFTYAGNGTGNAVGKENVFATSTELNDMRSCHVSSINGEVFVAESVPGPFSRIRRIFNAFPTGQPSKQPSSVPSRQPTCQPSRQPTRQPSRQPSARPSSKPSAQPSRQPSAQPTKQPTLQPSVQPSSQPTGQPSSQPSRQPSSQPSSQPTSQPSIQPSVQPSCHPSNQPSTQPSAQPIIMPTSQPTRQPSSQPTRQPISQPSSQPSIQPSTQPSMQPSTQPSIQPTRQPSSQPSVRPSAQPSGQPSVIPSSHPSNQP